MMPNVVDMPDVDILPTPISEGFCYHQPMPQKKEVLQDLLHGLMPQPVL